MALLLNIMLGGGALILLTAYFTTMHNRIKVLEDRVENMYMSLPSAEEVAHELSKMIKIPITSLPKDAAAQLKMQFGGIEPSQDSSTIPLQKSNRKYDKDPVKIYTG